jgi:transcription antitermination factor NusG
MMLDDGLSASAKIAHALHGANPSECGCHSALAWYVAVTGFRQECLARDEANRLGLSAFLPMQWDGLGRNRMLAPLFPGYLFVAFDVAEPEWRELYRRPGLKRLLGDDAYTPRAVRRSAVEALMAAASKLQVVDDPVRALLAAGARVVVHDAHPWLPGRKGTVVRSNRKVALVQIDGLSLPMKVDPALLSRLEA